MSDPKTLRINVGVDGRLLHWHAHLNNSYGHMFRLINYSMVNVYDVARLVWPSESRYRNAVTSKVQREHRQGRGDVERADWTERGPFYVERDRLAACMQRWCHRDAAAKQQLAAFDFDALMRTTHEHRRYMLQLALLGHDVESRRKRQCVANDEECHHKRQCVADDEECHHKRQCVDDDEQRQHKRQRIVDELAALQ